MKVFCFFWLFVFSCSGFCIESKGKVSLYGYGYENCYFLELSVRYKFSVLMGEPLEHFVMMWKGGSCKPTEVEFKAQLEVNGILKRYYVYFSPLVPSKSDSWGWDVSGSPSWSSIFKDDYGNDLDANIAKDIFKKGFKLKYLSVEKFSVSSLKEKEDKKR